MSRHDRDALRAQPDRLGARRAMLGILVALLHDSGYLKRSSEGEVENGAVFTKVHVSRSADFISASALVLRMTRGIPLTRRRRA